MELWKMSDKHLVLGLSLSCHRGWVLLWFVKDILHVLFCVGPLG